MTTRSEGNEGIVQSGGTLNISQSAVGHGATVNVGTSAEASELAALLAEVRRELATHRSELAEPEEVERSVAEVETELAKESPHQGFLRLVFDKLTAAVAGVTALAEPVGRLVEAVRRVLGAD